MPGTVSLLMLKGPFKLPVLYVHQAEMVVRGCLVDACQMIHGLLWNDEIR